ncbi:hypothetical protein H4Q26_012902 [Puccinia striiformis f. sp. tritici PST-130]|nr:hypothetical protein H4Q26_012902 [Puccinia striiformis f. sp. tritici PST-130]
MVAPSSRISHPILNPFSLKAQLTASFEIKHDFLNIGTSTTSHGIANKVGVKGLGIVVERTLIDAPCAANSLQQDLHVLIRHTDYDNLRKDKAVFDVMYIVPGNRLQQKLTDCTNWDERCTLRATSEASTLCVSAGKVQVLNLSVPSGNQTSVSPTKPSRPATKRNIKIQKVGSMVATATPAPVASTSACSHHHTERNAIRRQAVFRIAVWIKHPISKEGEVPETASGEPETEPPFKNTYPKRRSGADMISDAYSAPKEIAALPIGYRLKDGPRTPSSQWQDTRIAPLRTVAQIARAYAAELAAQSQSPGTGQQRPSPQRISSSLATARRRGSQSSARSPPLHLTRRNAEGQMPIKTPLQLLRIHLKGGGRNDLPLDYSV